MQIQYRLILLSLLLFIGAGLCVQYEDADRWEYPVPSEITSDLERYDGETILVFVDVEMLNGSTSQLYIKQYPHQVNIKGIDPDVIEQLGPEASIQVYGTLDTQSQQIIAEEIVIDTRGSKDREYIYMTSILGALVVTCAFFKYWQIDLRAMAFESYSNN